MGLLHIIIFVKFHVAFVGGSARSFVDEDIRIGFGTVGYVFVVIVLVGDKNAAVVDAGKHGIGEIFLS